MSETKLARLWNFLKLLLEQSNLEKTFVLVILEPELFPLISFENQWLELHSSSVPSSPPHQRQTGWLSSPVWPLLHLCGWTFVLQERLCAPKHPLLYFLCQNVCKIPTPTIDKTAGPRCLKREKWTTWLSHRKSFVKARLNTDTSREKPFSQRCQAMILLTVTRLGWTQTLVEDRSFFPAMSSWRPWSL